MLAPADLDVVCRDRSLPALALLLDSEALTAALQAAAPNLPLRASRARYVRYKRGSSCLVSYQLDLTDGETTAYAVTHARHRVDKIAKGRRYGVPLTDATTAFLWPDDARLRSVRRLVDREMKAGLLRRLLRGFPEFQTSEPRMLRHKPERRYVAELTAEAGTRAIVRVYTPAGFAAARLAAVSVRSDGPLRLPRLLGTLPRHRMLAMEWIEGAGMDEDAPGLCDAERLGAALVRLHRHSSAGLPHRTRQTELATMLRSAAAVSELCPTLAARSAALARRLVERFVPEPSVPGAIHGDFNAGQVILHPDEIGFVDLDEAALGDPMADLGSYGAALLRAAIAGRLPADRAEPLAHGVIEGYRIAGGLVGDRRLRWHTAAALLRGAVEPFRNRDPHWPEHVESVLTRAERLIAQPMWPARTKRPRPARVVDALGVSRDAALPWARHALDPAEAGPHLMQLAVPATGFTLREIRARRHKPGRRAVIEYTFSAGDTWRTWVGKMRSRGADKTACQRQEMLCRTSFKPDADDGIVVARPIGVVPALGLWLQERVGGEPATKMLTEAKADWLALRAAEAAHKIHRSPPMPARGHTIADELRILGDRLHLLAGDQPAWRPQLERLLEACTALGSQVADRARAPIHRDFYPDHLVVQGRTICIIDWDLYCVGDPAVDAGNFVAHLTEHALRERGDPAALADHEQAFVERFVQLGGHDRKAIDVYTTLTLARHVSLSFRMIERRGITPALFDLCCQRLTLASRGGLPRQRSLTP